MWMFPFSFVDSVNNIPEDAKRWFFIASKLKTVWLLLDCHENVRLYQFCRLLISENSNTLRHLTANIGIHLRFGGTQSI